MLQQLADTQLIKTSHIFMKA